VTDAVRVEAHEEDIQIIKDTQNWLLLPEKKAPNM